MGAFLHIHTRGTLLVLFMPDGTYRAEVEIADSGIIRVGVGPSPSEAITDAVSVYEDGMRPQ